MSAPKVKELASIAPVMSFVPSEMVASFMYCVQSVDVSVPERLMMIFLITPGRPSVPPSVILNLKTSTLLALALAMDDIVALVPAVTAVMLNSLLALKVIR